MRVLVVGGTEFISLHLVRALLRDRHDVVVLNRGRQPGRVPAGVKTIVADRKDHAALRRVLAGERVPGNGGWLRQLGHVEDLADAMAAMLGDRRAFGRAYNVSGEEAITQVGFVELIGEVLGRPVTLVSAAKPPFGQNLVYDCHAVYTTTRLRAELGIRPRYTLASGLAQTFEWYRREGLDRRDVDCALVPPLADDVVVPRVPGIFGPWMREYVLGWCLAITQRTETYRAAQRERRWREDVLPERLAGKTMAIVGLGDIGRAIAEGARALGVRVIGVNRSGRAGRGVERVCALPRLERALRDADFVVVVLPLTETTRGLVGSRVLAAMKRTAGLLNIGRGAVVDEAALLTALRERRLAGAVLDVFASEP